MSQNLVGKYLNKIEFPENQEIINEIIKIDMVDTYCHEFAKSENANYESNVNINEFYLTGIEGVELAEEQIVINVPLNSKEDFQYKHYHWFVKGFCTINDFNNWDNFYEIFIDEIIPRYRIDDCLLELEVIGGVINGQCIIDSETIEYWRCKGIYLIPVGFNEDGKLIKLDVFHEDIYNLDEEVLEKYSSEAID